MSHDSDVPRMRVSDHERDETVQRVQRAFADGRLTSAEMEVRLERALMARSAGDLAVATAELPGDPADTPVELKSTGSHVRRTGGWRVPRQLRIDSEYGSVALDLSQAVIEHPSIEIDLQLMYGSATIVLPPGATVDTDGAVTQWGKTICKTRRAAFPGRPHVRITGNLAYGSLRIRSPRAWRWLR